MKLLLISDIHYGKDVNYPQFGPSDYVNTLGSKFPALFSKLMPKVNSFDIVFDLGDCISIEGPEEDFQTYSRFLNYFKNVKIPTVHLLGNHDTACLTREQLMHLNKTSKTYHSFDFKGFHHIVLDPQLKDGLFSIDEKQIEWLREDIKNIKLKTIVYSHYHCDEQSMEDNMYFCKKPEKAYIKEKKELRDIFEKSGKVKAFFCGHTHFFHKEKINGILYVTVPSFCENDGKGNPKGEYLELILNRFMTYIKLRKVVL